MKEGDCLKSFAIINRTSQDVIQKQKHFEIIVSVLLRAIVQLWNNFCIQIKNQLWNKVNWQFNSIVRKKYFSDFSKVRNSFERTSDWCLPKSRIQDKLKKTVQKKNVKSFCSVAVQEINRKHILKCKSHSNSNSTLVKGETWNVSVDQQ
jgi:hypothetical protein